MLLGITQPFEDAKRGAFVTDRKFDSTCTCVRGPGVRGLGREGAFGARLASRVSPVYHLAHPFGPSRRVVEAQRPSLSRLEII